MLYFFENEVGAAVSVNGLRYRTMINGFLWPELEDMDVDYNWPPRSCNLALLDFFLLGYVKM